MAKTRKPKVTRQQIEQDLRAVVGAEIKRAYLAIGKAVEIAGRDAGARHGLEVVSAAFAAVLDTYAKPNANNPQGMSDDPAAFRRYFAKIIAGGADRWESDIHGVV